MTARAGIPAQASEAWRVLRQGLAAAGRDDVAVPCQADPELWFAEDPWERLVAAAECEGCPLWVACDGYAVAAREHFGVWAGHDRTVLSARQRAIRAAKAEAAAGEVAQ